jgi:hypothetical protein
MEPQEVEFLSVAGRFRSIQVLEVTILGTTDLGD